MPAATATKPKPDTRPRAPDPLHYPIAEPPAPGTATAVAPGVFWLRMPLPFVLNHINLWLLEDGAGWTIVDCGFATDEARGCWEKIFAGYLNGKPVTRVIVTHFHPDHIGLCDWLCQKFGVMPWITKAEYSQSHLVLNRMGGIEPELMRGLMMGHGLDSERMKWIEGREHLYPVGVPSLPRAHRRIREGEIIRIGANDWRVVVGHGHSPEHASLYCESLNLFIAGDMLLPRISTNVSVWPAEPEADPVGDFLASLQRYAALAPAAANTLVLPSHGLPFHGLHTRVDALHAHHQVRLDSVTARCATPQRAVDVLPALFDHDFNDHHLVFAMGEAIAHLNYLMHRGTLRRELDGSGHYRFQRVI
jgi:glyoxylase-like metal-dependent hydrolase (beta-lactamase superfamily II)